MSDKLGNFNPSSNNSGWGVQPGAPLDSNSSPKGDIHDTFQTNTSGDVVSGHTTVSVGDGIKTSIDWKS